MRFSGGALLTFALEQIGVKYTFGIPGVHNTEIYDELNNSKIITPILVTHEGGASFMADGYSRTSESIGTCMLVPAAGITHAASGIAEAYLDGIPMLVFTGGIRRDSNKSYQLHDLDQKKLTEGFVKGYFRPEKHKDIIPMIYEAFNLANSGEPGPVLIEIPGELQMLEGEVDEKPTYVAPRKGFTVSQTDLEKIYQLLSNANNPAIYVGWGAKESTEKLKELAELLNAPVCTTLQGLSVFPADHPLHTGMGFGRSAVPAGENAFNKHDCLLAIAVRFAELATGSYGIPDPKNLIHVDINPKVFNKNYKAEITIESDALDFCNQLLKYLKEKQFKAKNDGHSLKQEIKNDKESFFSDWTKKENTSIVSPGLFFKALREIMEKDAIVVTDDGNHTFLTEELLPIYNSKGFISPSDFNSMGYCVPAAIGAKLGNPSKQVIGIVGDGALMMTGLEMITATTNELGIIYFVFNDGELGQISLFQKIPLNRKTCTIIGDLKVSGVADAVGAQYLEINNDKEIFTQLKTCFEMSKNNRPVLVNVKIDYSKKTKFSQGVVKTNLGRFPLRDKVRVLGRAFKRHTLG